MFDIPASKLVLGLGKTTHVAKCLFAMHEDLGLIVNTSKTGCSGAWMRSRTGEVEAGGSDTQGHPLLCSKFEASLGYTRHYLNP